jgi:GT2 family glycosyltransferase
MTPAQPVTLCIVNYEGAEHLPRALSAARAGGFPFAEILVVDNGSTDESVAWLRREYPHVAVLELRTNRGPAGARNAGFAVARHDLVLFQDNDVQLDPRCAQTLLATLMSAPRALAVAARVLYANNPALIQYDSADCHFLGLMATRNADRPVVDSPSATTATTSLVTACFLIDRARWSGGRLFDEWFGFNYEDHDFGVRANVQGHELLIAPHARALHGGGTANLSYRTGGMVPRQRVFYLIRNRWCVLTKAFATRSLLLLAPLLLCYEIFQLVGVASKGWLGQWRAAVHSWWQELPRLRRERRELQRARRTPDRDILKGGRLPLTVAVTAGRAQRFVVGMLQWIAAAYWRLVRPLL